MQSFTNSSERIQQTCPKCGTVYIDNGIQCLVYHYGDGCCHYGDTIISAGTRGEPKGIGEGKMFVPPTE